MGENPLTRKIEFDDKLTKRQVPWKEDGEARLKEFLKAAYDLKTVSLKGPLTAMAERATLLAIESEDPAAFDAALEQQFCSHLAMDVPKKYDFEVTVFSSVCVSCNMVAAAFAHAAISAPEIPCTEN